MTPACIEALAKFISKADCGRPRPVHLSSPPSRAASMSGLAHARSAALCAIRQSSKPLRASSRPFSLWRQHDANVRNKKEMIRQHTRALEESRRRFSISAARNHGHIDPPKPGEELHVTFIDKDGDTHEFEVAEGDNLLDIAQANDLEMEGENAWDFCARVSLTSETGACGGSCACSTCHVIVQDEDVFDKIPEADDDEVRPPGHRLVRS